MIKARKQFVLCAMLSLFVLLLALLTVINGVNFTMASRDADQLTLMLSQSRETLSGEMPRGMRMDKKTGRPAGFGPLGPSSPEMVSSLRYFTFAFDEEGNGECVAWALSAVSQEDALTWARSLANGPATGWTAVTYRYRVYESEGRTCVTVIDQGRELLPSYRILIISAAGLVLGLIISCFVLMHAGRRLFMPLEEADRKQKRFIAEVEQEFKVPLTIVNANTEILERTGGETEQTRSINRQVKRMVSLVKDLGSLAVFDEKSLSLTRFDLSALALAAADAVASQFKEKGVDLRLAIEEHIQFTGDSDTMSDLMVELMDNAAKFSLSWASLTLRKDQERILLTAANDAAIPDGPCDQAFDRFTRLDNAKDAPGVGLGLAHAKEIVKAHNGRASAKAEDGVFILEISL